MSSNLSKRVQKAKQLNYSHNPHEPGRWGTWGSKGKDYGEKYYHVSLSHRKEIIITPDDKKTINVFVIDCQKNTGDGSLCNCPGNERHTVCYHGLGAIYRSFEQAKVKRLVSFFSTYEQAIQGLNFGGYIAKVKSNQGDGFEWCVVRDWPKSKEDEAKDQFNHTVTLMRGLVEDEAID